MKLTADATGKVRDELETTEGSNKLRGQVEGALKHRLNERKSEKQRTGTEEIKNLVDQQIDENVIEKNK